MGQARNWQDSDSLNPRDADTSSSYKHKPRVFLVGGCSTTHTTYRIIEAMQDESGIFILLYSSNQYTDLQFMMSKHWQVTLSFKDMNDA